MRQEFYNRNLEIIQRSSRYFLLFRTILLRPTYFYIQTSFVRHVKFFTRLAIDSLFYLHLYYPVTDDKISRECFAPKRHTFSHRTAITRFELSVLLSFEIGRWRGVYTLLCNAMLAVPIVLPLRGINRGLHSRVTNRIRAAALEVQFGRMTMFKVPRGRKFGSSRLSVLYLSAENSGLIVFVCSLHFENLEKDRSVSPFCLVCWATCNLLRQYKRNTSFEKIGEKLSIHSPFKFVLSFHNSKLRYYTKSLTKIYLFVKYVLNRQLHCLTIWTKIIIT